MTEKEYTDEELVLMLQNNDEEAFNLLYHRYVKLVYYIAYRICKNDADSQDIVQDTFLQVKRMIHNLKNPSLFKFWLNQIAISKCKNLFRKNKYVTYDDEHYEAKNNLIETREDVLPESVLKFESDKEVLNAFIDELPQGQKETVILHYLEQFSIEETAAILELPQGTVKSRLSYARNSLRKKIELYERTTGVKLNFHSVDGLIASALIFSLGKAVLPTEMLIPASTVNVSLWQRFSSAVSTKATVAAFASITLLTVGVGNIIFSNDAHTQENQLQNRFPAVTVRSTKITNAREAYFHIKTWACCHEEMMIMDTDKLKDVYYLYQIMKRDHSVYYEALRNEGWINDLERIYNERIRSSY